MTLSSTDPLRKPCKTRRWWGSSLQQSDYHFILFHFSFIFLRVNHYKILSAVIFIIAIGGGVTIYMCLFGDVVQPVELN